MLIPGIKFHAVIHANHTNLEINNFLNIARLFVHKVQLELETCFTNIKKKTIHNAQILE